MIGLSLKLGWFKSSLCPSHFIFDINVGKRRIRHTTTLKLDDEFLNRLKIDLRFKLRVVICRIYFFPTLISKMAWVWTTLKILSIFQDFDDDSPPNVCQNSIDNVDSDRCKTISMCVDL